MENFIVIAIVTLIVGLASLYIKREKKRGVQCIGCTDSCSCSGKCGSCGGCGGNTEI